MRDVWLAAADVGRLLRLSPTIGRFHASMQESRRMGATGYKAWLSQWVTSGPADAQPLLFGAYLQLLPEYEVIQSDVAFQAFERDARSVAAALTVTVEWLRAQLPGYPQYAVVDIDCFASRVIYDGFPGARFPWPLAARRAAFQLQPTPPPIGRGLEFAGTEGELQELISKLSATLKKAPVTAEFIQARETLDADDRAELARIISKFRPLARPDPVAEAAGHMQTEQYNYRTNLERTATDGASERVSRYYEAWRALDRAVEWAIAIITHVTLRGRPHELQNVSALRTDQERESWITVRTINDPIMPELNSLCAVEAALVSMSGVMVAQGTEMHFQDAGSDQRLEISGPLLPDSVALRDRLRQD